MTEQRWRFIDSGALPGAENMALDQAIMAALLENAAPPTLRVYGWQPDAVSLGRFQRAEASVDLEACRRLGVGVVRRPTGGRAILHTRDEVTFSIAIPAARLGTTGVMDAYRELARGITEALRLLGLDARLVARTGPAGPAAAQDPACFAVQARCDLVVGGAKVVGSAQVQRQGVILQQNSLPLRLHLDRWHEVFRRAAAPPKAVGLAEAAGRPVTYQDVVAALREGFSRAFGTRFTEDSPTEAERRLSAQLIPEVTIA